MFTLPWERKSLGRWHKTLQDLQPVERDLEEDEEKEKG
jgi:hypothetical protein